MQKFRFLFLFFLYAFTMKAQYTHLGSWNILNVKHDFKDKFTFFAEGQVRSLHFYDWFHYHELKAGIIYHNRPDMHIGLGFGKYDTYSDGGDFVLPKRSDEFRIWPQLVFDQKLGKFKMETRYRMELRFSPSGFRERFRQRVQFSYPIHAKLNASFSNELFFSTREPYFERNRAALNLNYKVSKLFSVMIGYLHQFDYKINDETGRDFLQLGTYFIL